jgi:hypothetical protein
MLTTHTSNPIIKIVDINTGLLDTFWLYAPRLGDFGWQSKLCNQLFDHLFFLSFTRMST